MNRRSRFSIGLHSLYLPYYDYLCDLLPNHWQPVSGFRSMQAQARIYEQGRSLPGKIVSNAKPGESPHNYGCATDWTVFVNGQPTWPDVSDPIWNEYGNAVEHACLRWGKSFKDYPHNELKIGVSWVKVKEHYEEHGSDYILSAIIK